MKKEHLRPSTVGVDSWGMREMEKRRRESFMKVTKIIMKKDNPEKREMELGSEYYKLWKLNAKQSMYLKYKIQRFKV